MHRFYFNECIPNGVSKAAFTGCLANTLDEFKILLDKEIDIESAVITHQLPSLVTYNYNNGSYTLLDAIDELPSVELRNFAYGVFNRYPIGAYFDDTDETLILQDWYLAVAGEELNAMNLAIVSASEGVAFSLPLADEIVRSPLSIQERNSEEARNVWNLYGNATNTIEIANLLVGINTARLGLLAQLEVLLGDYVLSAQFIVEFGYLTTAEQQSIIDDFQHAINRQMITRFYPDLRNVKDVTPDKNKCSVYELRVYRPSAIRVYFNESGAKIYVASIGYKNRQNQNAEIVAAHNTLFKMILTTK